MIELYVLLDYRSSFYSSTRYPGASFQIDILTRIFNDNGITLIPKHFRDIDLAKENYGGKWIIYQSSEDPDLLYKEYIGDILLALTLQGALLIPRFECFRAHHNKVFLELLRNVHSLDEIKNLNSKCFGTYEDYRASDSQFTDKSFVLKSESTSKSKGVYLLQTTSEKRKLPEKISRSFSFQNLSYLFKKIWTKKPYIPISNHRKKFIIQPYIKDIPGDYRVIIYDKKYYVLYRENRPNDFRASGSGRFYFDIALPDGLLEYASRIFESFSVPFIALDIGTKNGQFFLFEFQFLSFGQYTVEKSRHYFLKTNTGWEKVLATSVVEEVFAYAVSSFIKTKQQVNLSGVI